MYVEEFYKNNGKKPHQENTFDFLCVIVKLLTFYELTVPFVSGFCLRVDSVYFYI